MEDLQQVILQINNAPETRLVIQYGTDILPSSQQIINYVDLSSDEKLIWDNFINMVNNK
jgi:hypothetical protein